MGEVAFRLLLFYRKFFLKYFVFLDYFEMDIVSPGITRTAQTYFNLTHRTFLGKYSERREQKQQTGLIDFAEPHPVLYQ